MSRHGLDGSGLARIYSRRSFLWRGLMITVRLPDGSIKEVAKGTRVREVVLGIGKRLAEAAVAAKLNDAIVDLDREIPDLAHPVNFCVLTEKDRLALDVLRHSCAHIMARAVLR